MTPTRSIMLAFLLLSASARHCSGHQCGGKELSSVEEAERVPQRRSSVEDPRQREREWVRTPRLPPLDDIVLMTAECYNHPSSPLLKDVAPFEVPKERYARILLPFAQAELDPQPRLEDCELGTVHMSFSLGSSLRIVWFWTGRETRLRFSCGGLRYIATGGTLTNDQALCLDSLVRKIDGESRGAPPARAEAECDGSSGEPLLPALEDIEAISAEAYAHVLAPLVKDMTRFDVPKERFAEVLGPFRKESRPDAHLRAGDELGSLRLTLRGGRIRRICWFWVGHKGRMVFSYSGMRYMTIGTTFKTDETLEYDGRIRLIKQAIDAADEAKNEQSGVKEGN